jgi:hypothetical protein
VVARALESHGIVTTSISLVREHSEKVKPPRALFVPFPFGHAFGRPDDAALQQRVLHAALDLLDAPAGPVLVDFPDDAEPGDQPGAPTQASAVKPVENIPADVAAEVRDARGRYERWLGKSGGRSALGLSGLPAARFDDAALFLQRFAAGDDADMPERRAEVTLPAFIRWCADDLKTLYFEGYLGMNASAGGDEVARWFWGQTAAGQLLRRVRDRLDASDDPKWKAAAFGVAR